MKKFVFLLIVMLASCAPSTSTIQTAIAQTEIVKAEIDRTAIAQTQIAKPVSTPKNQVSTVGGSVATNTPYQNQSWRLPLMEDAELWEDDGYFNKDDLEWIKITATNLAIPSPYYWDWVGLPYIRYADALNYYRGIIEPRGYKLVQSEQGFDAYGYSDTYLIEFTKYISNTKTSKIVIEFWEKTADYDAQVIIFYVNPIE
jgi:hypothetical protein